MGYMIGMPCLKLNNVGAQSKKCGDFGSVAKEALEERQGRDSDIDRSKSADNLYDGFRTAAELQEYSRKHIEDLSAAQQAAGGRKVRADAVVMVATVIKPPAALMASLSPEDQIRFLRDADAKLNEIIGPENSKSTVIHLDEQGAHLHKFWEPMTKDGRLCAKEALNLKFFSRLNKEMPAHLRSCGWSMVDDCKAYDAAAEQLKSEQQKAEERKQKGLTSVQYKAQAEAEKNQLCEEIDELKQERREADQKALEARREAQEARDELQALQTVTTDARELQERYRPIRKTWTGKELYRPGDVDQIRKAAASSHAAQYELRQARSTIDRLRDQLECALKDAALERKKRRILEQDLNKERGLVGMLKRFLALFGLGQQFEEWQQKELAEIERKQEAIRERSRSLSR